MSRFYLRAKAGQSRNINFTEHKLWNVCFLRDLNSVHGRGVCYKPHVLSVWPQSLADCDKLFIVTQISSIIYDLNERLCLRMFSVKVLIRKDSHE